MKKEEPRDLEVGKTYFATNLSTDRRPRNLVRNKRYIVTVRGKTDAPSGPGFDRSKMPFELYLTNIKVQIILHEACHWIRSLDQVKGQDDVTL